MGSFFDLILVFIFIVLPVISNLIRSSQKRNQNKGRRPKQQTGQNPQQAPTQSQTAKPVVAKQVQPSIPADSSKSDFERRLAEARARVQQSMSEGGTQAPQAQPLQRQQQQSSTVRPQTQTPIPQARTTQSRPQARPQQRSLEVLKPLGGKSIESASLEGQSLERQSVEKPIRTKRQYTTLSQQQDNKSATGLLMGGRSSKRKKIVNSDELLTMDDKSIMRGLIWKQILDTPKSKKRIAGPSERSKVPSLEA